MNLPSSFNCFFCNLTCKQYLVTSNIYYCLNCAKNNVVAVSTDINTLSHKIIFAHIHINTHSSVDCTFILNIIDNFTTMRIYTNKHVYYKLPGINITPLDAFEKYKTYQLFL